MHSETTSLPNDMTEVITKAIVTNTIDYSFVVQIETIKRHW